MALPLRSPGVTFVDVEGGGFSRVLAAGLGGNGAEFREVWTCGSKQWTDGLSLSASFTRSVGARVAFGKSNAVQERHVDFEGIVEKETRTDSSAGQKSPSRKTRPGGREIVILSHEVAEASKLAVSVTESGDRSEAEHVNCSASNHRLSPDFDGKCIETNPDLSLRMRNSSKSVHLDTLIPVIDETYEQEMSENPGVSSTEPPTRRKKVWTGVRRQKRVLPLPRRPWTEDEFRQREKHILKAILAEQSEGRVSIDDVLNSWLGKTTRVELTNLMKAFGYMEQTDVALNILYWMQKQKGRLRPNRHVYSTILGVLGRAGMVSKARELFDSEALKDLGSVTLYNAMMGVYVKSGLFKRAWRLYVELCGRGLEADEATFNTLFSGISKSDMPIQMAEKLFTKMKLTGVSAGRFTYNILIMLYSKAGNFKAASQMFEEMKSADHLPDLCTFNTLICMHARAGQHEAAVRVFSTVKEVGLKPDAVTYTNLIQMFGKAHMLKEAVECFAEMQESGCKPDLMTYSLMVHVHGRAGRQREAEQALREMQTAGFRPNVVTWSSLMQVYGKQGMLAELNSCFAEVQMSGCRPDATLYNIMMNAYAQVPLPSQAASLFRQMVSRGISPTEACYNTMIHAHAQVGNLEEARAVAQQMVRAGFGPDKLSRRYLLSASGGTGHAHLLSLKS